MNPCDYKGYTHTPPEGRRIEGADKVVVRPGTSSSVKVASGHLGRLGAPSSVPTRQEGGVGRDEKKEREERKVFPATTHASKDTPKEERRRVPSYDESIQGHPRRKEGEERKEGKRERKREGEKGRREKKKKGRCSQLRTNVQGHTEEGER